MGVLLFRRGSLEGSLVAALDGRAPALGEALLTGTETVGVAAVHLFVSSLVGVLYVTLVVRRMIRAVALVGGVVRLGVLSHAVMG